MKPRYQIYEVRLVDGKPHRSEVGVAIGLEGANSAVRSRIELHAADLTFVNAHHQLCAGDVGAMSLTPKPRGLQA